MTLASSESKMAILEILEAYPKILLINFYFYYSNYFRSYFQKYNENSSHEYVTGLAVAVLILDNYALLHLMWNFLARIG